MALQGLRGDTLWGRFCNSGKQTEKKSQKFSPFVKIIEKHGGVPIYLNLSFPMKWHFKNFPVHKSVNLKSLTFVSRVCTGKCLITVYKIICNLGPGCSKYH